MSQLTQQPPTQTQPAGTHMSQAPAHHSGRYIGYVLYFVGAGLISGAVVHHPLDPPRYTTIALAGVAVFLAATVVNEFLLVTHRPHLSRMALIVVASLFLSFGIGMLSGGLQHFSDFPTRGAVLIPAGIVVSYIAFVVKDPHTAAHRIFGKTGLLIAGVAIAAYFGLSGLADRMGPAGDHRHTPSAPASEAPTGTGDDPADTNGTDDVPTPQPAENQDEHGEGEESPTHHD